VKRRHWLGLVPVGLGLLALTAAMGHDLPRWSRFLGGLAILALVHMSKVYATTTGRLL